MRVVELVLAALAAAISQAYRAPSHAESGGSLARHRAHLSSELAVVARQPLDVVPRQVGQVRRRAGRHDLRAVRVLVPLRPVAHVQHGELAEESPVAEFFAVDLRQRA